MAEERIQKILARAGYGSRRSSEELILAGRVKVNGKVVELGSKADPQRDTIMVDNQSIPREQAPIYVALNKPQGVLSEVNAEVSESRETVRDLVPVPGHLFIVGRLDYESEGLMLLTNDGDLANRLTHPRYGHEKEYRVQVSIRPDDRQYEAWRHGIVMEDGYRTAPAQVRLESVSGKNYWLQVILHEGRKRQIREMGRLTGLHVQRIQRVRIGTLLLGDLKPGQWRHLRPEEVRALKATTRAGREKPRMRTTRPLRRLEQRSPEQGRPAQRGPESRGTEQRGLEQRGSEQRRPSRWGSEQGGPAQRGPEQRGSEQRGPEQRGTEQRGSEQRGPEQRRPSRRSSEQGGPARRIPEQRGNERRGPEQHGPEQRGTEQRGSEQRGPEQRRPARRSPVQRGTEQRRPAQRGPAQRRRR